MKGLEVKAIVLIEIEVNNWNQEETDLMSLIAQVSCIHIWEEERTSFRVIDWQVTREDYFDKSYKRQNEKCCYLNLEIFLRIYGMKANEQH